MRVVMVPDKLFPVDPGVVRVLVPEKLKQYKVDEEVKLPLGNVTT